MQKLKMKESLSHTSFYSDFWFLLVIYLLLRKRIENNITFDKLIFSSVVEISKENTKVNFRID